MVLRPWVLGSSNIITCKVTLQVLRAGPPFPATKSSRRSLSMETRTVAMHGVNVTLNLRSRLDKRVFASGRARCFKGRASTF